MTTRFVYPAILTPDEGKMAVEFSHIPEALTVGSDEAEACMKTADCLDEAIAGRIIRRNVILTPSANRGGQINIAVPPLMATKASHYLAMRGASVSNVALARLLDIDERQVRWMLDPKRTTRLPQIERALVALGRGLEIRLIDRPSVHLAKRENATAARGRKEPRQDPQPVPSSA
jgi:antitoxin HicB